MFLAVFITVAAFIIIPLLIIHIGVDRPLWAMLVLAKLFRWKVVILESSAGNLEYGRELITPLGKRVFKPFESYRSDVLLLDNNQTKEYSPRDWSYY